jgi:phosphomethylpyrimidine synthase
MTSVSVRTVSAPTAVTTGPIQGSGKRYAPVPGWEPMVFPVRRIGLTNGEHLDVYDTSGPYTDPSAVIDVHAGLPRTRDGWQRPTPIYGVATQLEWARAGLITPEMAFCAAREGLGGRSSSPRSRRCCVGRVVEGRLRRRRDPIWRR